MSDHSLSGNAREACRLSCERKAVQKIGFAEMLDAEAVGDCQTRRLLKRMRKRAITGMQGAIAFFFGAMIIVNSFSTPPSMLDRYES
jgi:hypothetical protein